MEKRALIIINCQNDFFEGGSLGVPNSLKIISVINRVKQKFKIIIFSKDWHLENHTSFKQNGGMWQTHCVQETFGSELHSFIKFNETTDYVIHKGTKSKYDSYSAFYNAKDIGEKTQLNTILKKNSITQIYICGLGIEYDIFSTIMDGYRFRYKCYLILDAITGFDKKKVEKKLKYLNNLGVTFLKGEDV